MFNPVFRDSGESASASASASGSESSGGGGGDDGEESDGPAVSAAPAEQNATATMPSTVEPVDDGRHGDQNGPSAGSADGGGQSQTDRPHLPSREHLDAGLSPTVGVGGEEMQAQVASPDPDRRVPPLIVDRVVPELIVLDSPEREGEVPPANHPGAARRESAEPAEPSDRTRKRPYEAVEQAETRSPDASDSTEIDQIACPICMEPWTNSGDHRVCCLTCGHLFGKSCIVRWLRQEGRKLRKCPQCNKRARLEDVRPLYVARVAVADGQGQQLAQEVRGLKAENHWLRAENARLLKQLQMFQETIARVQPSTSHYFANVPVGRDSLRDDPLNIPTAVAVGGEGSHSRTYLSEGNGQMLGVRHQSGPDAASMRSPRDSFVIKSQVKVHGGRVFDMDADSQAVLFSNKIPGCANRFRLSKLSLLALTEMEEMRLPLDFGAIRDIRLSPSGIGGPGKLALVALGGKKLCVISPTSNNVVLTYSVQSPPWSCAWDPSCPHLVYSGLQNGSLLEFDLRQTSSPVAVLKGPSSRPIHTLQVVPSQPDPQEVPENHLPRSKEILSASNTGVFRWNADSPATSDLAWPQCIFSSKQKVCVSLAYSRSTDTAVASFRQSPLAQCDASTSGTPSSQPLDGPEACRPSPAVMESEEPSHWIFNRGLSEGNNTRSRMNDLSCRGEGNLGWRWVGAMAGHESQSGLMPRGTIVSMPDASSSSRAHPLFAGGDERTNKVWLWDMETLRLVDVLEPAHESPVLDVKCAQVQGTELLCSMSDATFHIHRWIPS